MLAGTGAGCASAEVDRLIKLTDATLVKAAPHVAPAVPGETVPGKTVPVEPVPVETAPAAPPRHAAAYDYWTAVAYLGEAKRLRSEAEYAQALAFLKVAQKAAVTALQALEAP